MDLHGRNLLKEVDLTKAEFLFVFDQAENRLHIIKAAMVATIGD